MKTIIKVLLIILTITVNSVDYAVSATKTWSGNTNTDWYNSGNWVGGIVADSSDNIVINSNAPNNLILTQNQKITNLTINGDTVDLGGFTFEITGTAYFNGGLVKNGLLKPIGSLCHFGGATLDARIEATCGYFHMNSGVYKKPVFLTSTGAATSSSTSGNHFEDSLTITNNGAVYFNMGSSGEDIYDGPVILYNYSSKEIRLGVSDTSYFNNHVTVNASSGGVEFGASGGVSILASGKTISVGTFSSSYLTLAKFIQLGSTAQTLTLSGTGVVSLEGCIFNGNLIINSPGILTKTSTYYGNTTFNRTGSVTNFHSYGSNTYAGNVTWDNAGSGGRIRLASNAPDTYLGDATFSSSGGQDVQVAYIGDNSFTGNMTINSNKVVFNTSTGKVTFTGINNQTLNGSYNYTFKNVAINKSSGNVTANSTLSVDDSLIFILGNLITTSTNLITMKHGSTATGASNSSFVSGPVKKVGSSAFTFPTGKNGNYRALEITAPANSSDAFTAEFINNAQGYGSSFDTSLVNINTCDYWTLARTTGTSNVKVSLYWNASSCAISYPINTRVASWNGSNWANLGNDAYGGTLSNGFVKALNNPSSFSAFLLANIETPFTGAPALGIAASFALLAKDSIYANNSCYATGKVGSQSSITNISANDSIYDFNSGNVSPAIDTLINVIAYVSSLSTTIISGTLNNDTLIEGNYSIYSNTTLSQNLNLQGDTSSIFIFNVTGILTIDSGANVILNGVKPENLFWIVGEFISNGNCNFPGIVISKNGIESKSPNTHFIALLSLADIILEADSNDIGNNIYYSSTNMTWYHNALSIACNYSFNGCNEVYNSTFDFNLSIPNSPSQINLACPWYNARPTPPGGTPDYFHLNASAISNVSLPNRPNGCQNDNSGTGFAYAGLYNQIDREYIQQQLHTNLVASQLYYGEFFVSLADKCIESTDRLGMLLTTNPVIQTLYGPIIANAQIESPAGLFLDNHSDWIRISGCFLGNGEVFLTIGNFNSSVNSISHTPSSVGCTTSSGATGGGYYYIDDPAIMKFEVNAGSDITVNCEETVQLGLSTCITSLNTGQFTYNWVQLSGPSVAVSNSAIYNPTVSLSNSTGSPVVYVYQVTVTSPNGCVATDLINVTVESCGADACDNGITYCFENYPINGFETWDAIDNPACSGNIVTIENEIIIGPGETLIIDGIEVHFGPNGKIIVERGDQSQSPNIIGGRLYIQNGAKLIPASNECMWEGIQVWGFKTLKNTNPLQGRIAINDSEISYAHCGVYFGRRDDHLSLNLGSFTGGLLEVISDNLFKDNYVSIWFPLGYPIKSSTSFNIYQNEFLCESAMRDPFYMNERSKYFIDINRRTSSDPYISGGGTNEGINYNVFHNTPPLATNSTIAVRCNSSVSVSILSNDFVDVDRGVFFLSSNGNGYSNIVTEDNQFKNCNVAIYNLNNKINSLYGSTIIDGIPGGTGISLGIVSDYSPGTSIRSNLIDNYDIGIDVARSGNFSSLYVNVWNNYIDNTPMSLYSGGNNYFSTWWCNKLHKYDTGIGWTLFDIGSGTGINTAKVQEQGSCGNYPAGNEFNVLASTTIFDISNQTASANSLIYNRSVGAAAKYIPNATNGAVTVNSCFGQDENDFCTHLPPPLRIASEILAQRDTTRDTTMLNILNSEILGYYIRVGEMDSAIAFIYTMNVDGVDEILLDLYFIIENIDSVQSIINRLPSITEDDIGMLKYWNLMYELMNDSLTLFDMDSLQLAMVAEMALGESKNAFLSKGILNTIYGKPIDLTCEVLNACESSRYAIPKIDIEPNNPLQNFPNPCVVSTNFQIPDEARIRSSVKLLIYNSMGQVMARIPITNQPEYEYYCNNLPNGLYLYFFEGEEYRSNIGKMVVIKN